MLRPATVIVLASPAPDSGTAHGGSVDSAARALTCTLQRVIESGLPALVVTAPEMVSTAGAMMPFSNVLPLEDNWGTAPGNWIPAAIKAGVEASASAGGWILLPVRPQPPSGEQLQAMANSLTSAPLVKAAEPSPAPAMGVGAELFSELVRLTHARDLNRLASRYPVATLNK